MWGTNIITVRRSKLYEYNLQYSTGCTMSY